MTDAVIQWRRGSRFSGSAKPAYERTEELRAIHGHLSPKMIVDDAKENPDGPLSKHVIDCKPKEAADRYYLGKARHLLRSIEVVRTDAPGAVVPSYVRVTHGEQHEPRQRSIYTSTEEALENPAMRTEVLNRAMREALQFRKKYAALSELAVVIKAIDESVESAAV